MRGDCQSLASDRFWVVAFCGCLHVFGRRCPKDRNPPLASTSALCGLAGFVGSAWCPSSAHSAPPPLHEKLQPSHANTMAATGLGRIPHHIDSHVQVVHIFQSERDNFCNRSESLLLPSDRSPLCTSHPQQSSVESIHSHPALHFWHCNLGSDHRDLRNACSRSRSDESVDVHSRVHKAGRCPTCSFSA